LWWSDSKLRAETTGNIQNRRFIVVASEQVKPTNGDVRSHWANSLKINILYVRFEKNT
jgi:hypothetical protein